MRDWIEEHKEIVQGFVVVLGVIIVIGGLFIVSENTGDRSLDKAPVEPTPTPTEENQLLEEGEVLDEEKMKEMEKITYEEFEDLLKKKTTSVIMLGYDTCYWCQQQKPILQSVMYDYDIDVKYLDTTTLLPDEHDELSSLHEDLESFGTPTFIAVKNKKVTKVQSGAMGRSNLIATLTDMGIIKEED